MTRVTIIPSDGFIAVDGEGYLGLDLSGIDPRIHAVQFDSGAGHIEYKRGVTPGTVEIDNVNQFQIFIDRHAAHKARIEALAADPLCEMPASEAVAAAVAAKIVELDRFHDSVKYANFSWGGHEFYVDRDAVEDVDKTDARCRRLPDDAPVPTPAPVTGHWVAADIDPATGTRAWVPMTVGRFLDFKDDLYDHRGRLWVIRGGHETNIRAMAAAGATYKEIQAYDVTLGWE